MMRFYLGRSSSHRRLRPDQELSRKPRPPVAQPKLARRATGQKLWPEAYGIILCGIILMLAGGLLVLGTMELWGR